MPRTLINVSNRLPVTIDKDQITKSSGGLVAALEGLAKEEFATRWIGWPGASIESAERQTEVEQILQSEHGCIPVFLTEEQVSEFYEGLSNSSIWPLLHDLPNFMRYQQSWWKSYEEVNRIFAEKTLEQAHPGDLVWVHDYQLMLLPALLRAQRAELSIGFFLHTPFPAYEIFRCHPRRKELVNGLLGANLVGFHTFGYLRHFCSAVQRLSDAAVALTSIEQDQRHTALGVYPIGVNAPKFDETLDSAEFEQHRKDLQAAHEGKQVIVSVERLDYTKGILHRLDAIDLFLAEAPDVDALKFIFVSVPSREGIEEYQTLREEIEMQVGRLNGKYASLRNSPIRFIHGSIPFVELCALYASADVAIVTPLVDGMNLVAKEFIACQRDAAGVLILSEFAGAAEELFNAVRVNPYDAQTVAEAIKGALVLPKEQRRERNAPMRERVVQFDARHWARAFVGDLATQIPRNSQSQDDLSEAWKMFETARQNGRPIALFVDYDGTLREIESEPRQAIPTPPVLQTLKHLQTAADIELTVISGRSRQDLQEWFSSVPIRLVAEHGASLREASGSEWRELDQGVNYGWKAKLRPILEILAESTPGSLVEEKRSSLVWHYRQVEPQLAEWKARQFAEELAAVAANEPIRILRGRKTIEASAAQVSKGTAVARLLEKMPSEAVVVCAGDDYTDESMFNLQWAHLVSIKVGREPTHARFRLADPAAIREFLNRLAGT
jgi:trehalose 6-phosphate synthase/phosphatase